MRTRLLLWPWEPLASCATVTIAAVFWRWPRQPASLFAAAPQRCRNAGQPPPRRRRRPGRTPRTPAGAAEEEGGEDAPAGLGPGIDSARSAERPAASGALTTPGPSRSSRRPMIMMMRWQHRQGAGADRAARPAVGASTCFRSAAPRQARGPARCGARDGDGAPLMAVDAQAVARCPAARGDKRQPVASPSPPSADGDTHATMIVHHQAGPAL
eukprot:scaffold1500_cov398-Prasinococcus_capsulatus_cf.AAC.10